MATKRQWSTTGVGTQAEQYQFIDHVDEQVPEGLEIDLVLDNYGTHKTPTIKRWLKRHPRHHCILRLHTARGSHYNGREREVAIQVQKNHAWFFQDLAPFEPIRPQA